MKANFENHRLRTLLWIVKQLEQKPMSLSELNERWERNTDLSAGLPIERRTFCNYIHAIWDMLHIDIECDRKDGYRYSIVDKEKSNLTEWMLENFEQQMALERGFELKGRILTEEPERGVEHLCVLVDAMANSKKVVFSYKDFNSEECHFFRGEPYALKVYQKRWYVVMRVEKDWTEVFSLDRIEDMRLTDEPFVMDPAFDARDFFKYSFGVRVINDEQPSKVVLKVRRVQCEYLRKLPLHHSQQEVDTRDDYSIFQLTVVPTVELTMKLLSMGQLVEVLEPADLRATLKEEAKALYDVYCVPSAQRSMPRSPLKER